MMHTEWEEVIFANWTLKRYFFFKWNKIIAVYVVPSKRLFSSLWNGLEQTDGPIGSIDEMFHFDGRNSFFFKTYMYGMDSIERTDGPIGSFKCFISIVVITSFFKPTYTIHKNSLI